MAAFTSMALLGAGLLGGAVATKLATRGKKDDQQLAPQPTDQNPLAPPAPPILDPADMNAQAQQAGMKQRKRAAAGSLLTAPVKPASNVAGVAPRYAQRTLLGQ